MFIFLWFSAGRPRKPSAQCQAFKNCHLFTIYEFEYHTTSCLFIIWVGHQSTTVYFFILSFHFNQMIIIWYYIETLCCCQKWQLAQILKSPRILGCWNVTCGQILHSCKSLPVLGCILPVIGQILCDSKSLPVLGWMGDLANRRRRFSQDLVKDLTH